MTEWEMDRITEKEARRRGIYLAAYRGVVRGMRRQIAGVPQITGYGDEPEPTGPPTDPVDVSADDELAALNELARNTFDEGASA